MLPSSSSQLARYGHINHYKKFWLLQTQLEKQEQSSTSLSLGVTGNANHVKESKPLVSSTPLIPNGDHLINNNNIAGHGSCRADMATCSASSSRAGAFPYCSNEPAGSLRFYAGYTHMSNGSLRDSPALSLAVNCESVAHPINFLNQTWSPSSLSPASHELQLLNLPNLVTTAPHTSIPEQAKVNPVVEECESSECSNGGGEKRGLLWDSASTSQSTSTSVSLPSKQQQDILAGPQSNPPSSIVSNSLHEVAALPSPSRIVHGGSGPLRICTLCGTTKTPLWRGGPNGPKSLCNACGIRVKKMKRLQAAMEAADFGADGIVSSASSPGSAYKRLLATATKTAGRPGTLKRKLSMEAAENQNDPNFQVKKKKKAAGLRRSSCCSSWRPSNVAGSCNLDSGTCYRGFWNASANLADRVVADSTSSKNFSSNLFAQDVEEAAVLLMALSCGLVLS